MMLILRYRLESRSGRPTPTRGAEGVHVGVQPGPLPGRRVGHMSEGTIKKLVSDRGFGFIVPEGATDGKDLFFHSSDVQGTAYDSLREGQKVSFELGRDERRGTTKATKVMVV